MSGTRKPPPVGPATRKPPRITPSEKGPLDEPVENVSGSATMTETGSLRRLPPQGKSDTQSRSKAESSVRQADLQQPEPAWPMSVNGRPLARIEFSASELIPTGQYANVSIGPARITAFVDLGRVVDDEEPYFNDAERDNLVKAINELAEMVERDVVAVQRNLVLESIQAQKNSDGN